jgi:hypothetical protein
VSETGAPTGYCHDCQLKRGGTPPKWNPQMIGNTMSAGTCKDCKLETWLSPSIDYDWPNGNKAIWD